MKTKTLLLLSLLPLISGIIFSAPIDIQNVEKAHAFSLEILIDENHSNPEYLIKKDREITLHLTKLVHELPSATPQEIIKNFIVLMESLASDTTASHHICVDTQAQLKGKKGIYCAISFKAGTDPKEYALWLIVSQSIACPVENYKRNNDFHELFHSLAQSLPAFITYPANPKINNPTLLNGFNFKYEYN